jgi:hypothetical protein
MQFDTTDRVEKVSFSSAARWAAKVLGSGWACAELDEVQRNFKDLKNRVDAAGTVPQATERKTERA